YGLAEVARSQGDLERAISLMEEAHELTLQQGDRWSIAFALGVLGSLILVQGRLVRARQLQQQSLALRRDIRDSVGIARCLCALGWVAAAEGQWQHAARLFGAGERLRERGGAAPHPPWLAEHERWSEATRVSLGEQAFRTACDEGRALALDEAIAFALRGGEGGDTPASGL